MSNDASAARKLETEHKKLVGYASVMLVDSRTGPLTHAIDRVPAMRAAAHALQTEGIGSGSWVAAAQGLTGQRALNLLDMMKRGKLAGEPEMQPSEFERAIAIARIVAPRNSPPLPFAGLRAAGRRR